jgi:hypothetical protein
MRDKRPVAGRTSAPRNPCPGADLTSIQLAADRTDSGGFSVVVSGGGDYEGTAQLHRHNVDVGLPS